MKKLMLLGCGLLLLVGLAVGAKIFVGQMVDSKLRQATNRLKDRADIGYKDVEVQILGMNLVVHDVDVALPTGQKLRIDTVTVHDMDVKNKPPRRAVVDLEGVKVDVNQDNFGADYESLRELGFETLMADVHLDYVYSPEKGTLLVQDFRADAPGLARVEASLGLSSFELGRVKQLQLDDLVIEKLHFFYEDQSLLRTMVQMTQEDEQEIIDFLVAGLREDIERARRRGQEQAVSTMQEIISFIQTPAGIEIDVELGGRTPMQQIMASKKITEIVKLFSIKVEAAG